MTGFFEGVYRLVAQIPAGKVVTYGQLATLLGQPRAARTVGWAMSASPEGLPWHRVVNARGVLRGGDEGALQRAILEAEDVPFRTDGCIDMAKCLWHGPVL